MNPRKSTRLLTFAVLLAICAIGPARAEEADAEAVQADPTRAAADSWDRIFRDKPYRPVRPSESFLAYCVQRSLRQSILEPGNKALVLAMGDGANAIHLAKQGLDVTGLDISPVAIEAARGAAVTAGVRLQTVQANLFEYDMGEERWDLVTNIYFNPAIRVIDTLKAAVRPGGLLLIEGFGADHEGPGPPQWSRYGEGQLLEELAGWRILEYQDGLFPTIWAQDRAVPVVRVLARKPAASGSTREP